MELISIIPDFQPRSDPRLLAKAEALKPVLQYTEYPIPSVCLVNGETVAAESLSARPLYRGDQVLLDFGRHLVGRLTLNLSTAGSHQDAPAFIQLDFAEMAGELTENPEDYHGWLSHSWIQQERLHLDRLPAAVTLPRRYAFRYVRLTVLDTSPKYQLVLKDAMCRAESAANWANVPEKRFPDGELKRIYDAGLRTLAECTQDVLEDGPKRDQRLWLGDMRLEALTSYTSFRSMDVIKRCLYLFAGTRFPDGRMSANVFTSPEPAADDTFLMDYALLYPVALEEYLAETGDAETLKDLLEPALEQGDWVLAHWLNGENVLKPDAGKTGFIDWSDALDRTAALQGVLILSLDACAALCVRAGDGKRRGAYENRAASLREAALRHFWSAEEQCFLSGGQISIHTQVWLTLAGVMPDGKARAAFEKALETPGAPQMATPYMHHYYVTALLKAGLKEEAEKHLRAYWGGMLNAGADTFWECYDPADLRASPYGGMIVNSYCHAWSCTPAYLIDKYFL